MRAADAAERVHAHGEAGALLERALDLWPRVPDAEAQAGCDRDELLRRAGRALINDGGYIRAEALLRTAVGEVDEAADPRRAADLLELLSRAQWSLGRASDSRDSIARAVGAAPGGRPQPGAGADPRAAGEGGDAAGALQRGAARRRGGVRRCAARGRRRPVGRRAQRDGLLPDPARRGRGRERPAARGDRDLSRGFERTSAWANLAEALHLVGRSQEGLAAAEQGLADTAGEGRFSDWLSLGLLDIRWALGDWEAARAALPPRDKRHIGMTLAYVETLRAAVALADGEHDEARASLERSADVIQGSREPQFLGWFGSLRGELERRCGDLAAARAAIDDGLDAIEFCSEDLPRLALLSETGAAIEGDAAQRARDLGDETAEREAISRAELFEMRAEACADDVRPVEVARLETVRAHLARARGKPDPELDAAAAEAWRAVARPYPMAIAQLHRAETLVERGERDDAAAQLADVLATAEELGAPWLRAEAEGLAGRARLPLPTGEEAPAPEPAGEDPFGLTPRELQVLKLLAEGATNREIGAQLFMAEKTASVHVSRILAKLDVRSRTEAAAVAHRFGVVG